MRVLLITEASSAGVGRHILDLAEGLLDQNCETHLIYSALRIDTVFRERVESIEGLTSFEIGMRRGPHPSDIKALKDVRAYVKKHGPFDIVHGHSSKAGVLVRSLRKREASSILYTPHCVYTMNRSISGAAFLFFRMVERVLARKTDAIIAVSPDEHDHLVEIGIPKKKVHTIINGVPPSRGVDRDAIRKELGLPQDDCILGFIGRLSHQKNPLLMIRTFAELRQRHQGVSLAMVGDGPLLIPAKTLAEELGVADSVHWLGYQKGEEVLPAFDVFCLTSRYEAMPYVLLEAIASGTPIVAKALGGARLVIEEGANGFTVDSDDPEPFANALDGIVTSRQLRGRLAKGAMDRAPHFSINTMIERTLALYQDLQNGTLKMAAT